GIWGEMISPPPRLRGDLSKEDRMASPAGVGWPPRLAGHPGSRYARDAEGVGSAGERGRRLPQRGNVGQLRQPTLYVSPLGPGGGGGGNPMHTHRTYGYPAKWLALGQIDKLADLECAAIKKASHKLLARLREHHGEERRDIAPQLLTRLG